MKKKLVILAAVNGGAQQNRDGAEVPISPAEIAEAAHECYKAGASVVHVHARAPDGQPTTDVAIFSEIIRRVREKCDILIQTTNGFGVRRDPKSGECTPGPPIASGWRCIAWNRSRTSFRSPPGRGTFITPREGIRAPSPT